MDTYSNSASSSSSSYSNEFGRERPPQAYRAALRAVRKIPGKNIITKKSIAPMPPVPPKIYKVDPLNFRDVVQSLTAGPKFRQRPLQEVAPPPLSVSPPAAVMSPLGFSNSLSPSSLAWCSSMLFTPQTLDPTSL